MKNFLAAGDAVVTLTSQGQTTSVPLYSKQGLELLGNLWLKLAAEFKLMYEPTWLGRPIIQLPADIVFTQEMIWRLKPDVIVETGVAHGGSLVLSASIMELVGKGKVVGVDVEIRPHNRAALEAHPLCHRIELIEGSSIDEGIVAAVREHCAGAQTVMVILDSNHSHAHVARELELYSPLVTPGSYLIAQDGGQALVADIPRAKPEWATDHPLSAIHEFLAVHKEFRIDPHYERLYVTSSPDGYLRRLTEEEMQAP